MPNVFQRFGQWVRNQRNDFNAQLIAKGHEDFKAEMIRGHDEIVARINSLPNVTDLQKEEMRLEALQRYYENPGEPEKGMRAQRIAWFNKDKLLDAYRESSLGARLGRLFSGRGATAAKRRAMEIDEKLGGQSGYGFLESDAERLVEIRAARAAQTADDRAARAAQAADDRAAMKEKAVETLARAEDFEYEFMQMCALQEAVVDDQLRRWYATPAQERERFNAMSLADREDLVQYERLNYTAILPTGSASSQPPQLWDENDMSWFLSAIENYTHVRDLQPFMKTNAGMEEAAEYNIKVLKTFNELGLNEKVNDEEFAAEVLKNAIQTLKSYDIKNVDLTNPLSDNNLSRYPDLEYCADLANSIRQFVSPEDAGISDACFREIFPDQEAYNSFDRRSKFITAARDSVRSELLRHAEREPQSTTSGELGDTKNYRDYTAHYNEIHQNDIDVRHQTPYRDDSFALVEQVDPGMGEDVKRYIVMEGVKMVNPTPQTPEEEGGSSIRHIKLEDLGAGSRQNKKTAPAKTEKAAPAVKTMHKTTMGPQK